MIKILVGKDSGNGTDLATARIKGGHTFRSFTGGYMASGDEIKKISSTDITGKTVSLTDEQHKLNGNTALMKVRYAGTNMDYYIGISSSLIASGISPINPTGLSKYNNEIYMRVMLQASIQGLMNDGMSSLIVAGGTGDLKICFGLAPEYYFDEVQKAEVIANLHTIFDGFTFEYNKVTFQVSDFIVRPEAIGAFFNYITDDKLNFDEVKDSKRYLIEDGGQMTFDTLIVADMNLWGDPDSNDQLGSGAVFSQSRDEANRSGVMKLTTTDMENIHYGCANTKAIDLEACQTAIDNQKKAYMSGVQSYAGGLYDQRSGDFDFILVTGGITKLFTKSDLENKLKIRNRPVIVLGVHDNADGFSKLADMEMGG